RDPDLRRSRGGALTPGHEIDAQRRRQDDHVDVLQRCQRDPRGVEEHRVTTDRQVRHAVPVNLESGRAARAVEYDLGLAVKPAAGDVHPGDVVEQVGERLDVGERERVGGEAVARATRQRAGGRGRGEHGGGGGRRVPSGGVVGGGGAWWGGVDGGRRVRRCG